MALANPTVNTGDRSTAVNIDQNRRVIDMRDEIYDYDPDASPFLTVLSRRLPSVVAENPEYKHLEDQPLPWWDTVGTTFANATATAITVSNGSFFRAGDVILFKTTSLAQGYELCKVVSVATNVLTVIRNWDGDQTTGGTQAGTPNGSNVSIIGNINEEMAGKRTIKTTQEAMKNNYCQILRDPFGASNTLQGSKLYGGNERSRQRKKFTAHHNMVIERAFLFGRKKESTGPNGHKERATGGLESWIATNKLNASGTLTDATIESWCETLFRYTSSKTKLVIASRRFATQLDNIGALRLQIVPRADTYGVAMRNYTSSHGDLMIAISDVLTQDYAGYAFAVDMEHVFKRHMNDDHGQREARLNTNIQSPDVDGWEDEYLSEVGLHVTNEAMHGVLFGF